MPAPLMVCLRHFSSFFHKEKKQKEEKKNPCGSPLFRCIDHNKLLQLFFFNPSCK
jgi:hypothetical protein